MIYFIRAGESEAVKIGKANDAAGRLRELQVGNHETLILIREMPGEFQQEDWLHKHFATRHISREWFRFTPEMMTVEVSHAVIVPTSHREILNLWPSDNEMAGDLRIKPERVRKWRQRRIPSDWWHSVITAAAARGWPLVLGNFVQSGAA